MKKYKHITIRETNYETDFDGGLSKTYSSKPDYTIINNKTGKHIGLICWSKFKCYEFEAAENTAWTTDCLADIIDFINNVAERVGKA